MNMIYEAVRDALVILLGTAQGTDWNTIGFAERDQSAAENNALMTAQVYFNSGDFPKSNSSMAGPIQHDMKFHVILTVAENAKGDVTAMDNATTEAEYAAAVASFSRSEFEADRKMDDFLSKIWLLIMAPQNRYLGLDIATYPRLSNRWIPNVKKEQPKRSGNFCTIRAMLTIEGLIPEDVAGIDVSALPEYITPPYSGDIAIKDNINQSGNLDTGEPVV
ncbi:hypothetical protein KA005_16735 [bacterium]|nr:hypothetical protein [bacterium]